MLHPPHTATELFQVGMDRTAGEFIDVAVPGAVMLNLGPGNKHLIGVDELEWPEWNAEVDPTIPRGDGSVDAIFAFHFLEHLTDPRPVLRECQRVLRSGGTLNVVVPFYKSSMAFHDFDHKSYYTETCWDNLFRETYYSKGKTGWEFTIQYNAIVGVVERNLALVTQLVRH